VIFVIFDFQFNFFFFLRNRFHIWNVFFDLSYNGVFVFLLQTLFVRILIFKIVFFVFFFFLFRFSQFSFLFSTFFAFSFNNFWFFIIFIFVLLLLLLFVNLNNISIWINISQYTIFQSSMLIILSIFIVIIQIWLKVFDAFFVSPGVFGSATVFLDLRKLGTRFIGERVV